MKGWPIIVAIPLLMAMGGRRRGSRTQALELRKATEDDLVAIANAVEELTGLVGFADFALVVSYSESRGNNLIARGVRTSALPPSIEVNESVEEADAACRAWKNARENGFYLKNPYPEPYWCFGAGGWFQFLPATGLAAGGVNGPFARSNPLYVFHPEASVAMLYDLVRRIARTPSYRSLSYESQNWFAIRRGMRALSLIADEASASSAAVLNRMNMGIQAHSISPDLPYQHVDPDAFVEIDRVIEELGLSVG